MLVTDHDNTMLEAVCTWELLRSFGYPASEIYFSLMPSDEPGVDVAMSIKHEGRDAAIRVGHVPYDHEEANARWQAVAGDWINATNSERMELYENSHVRSKAVTVIAGFRASGFGSTPEQIEEFRENHRSLN